MVKIVPVTQLTGIQELYCLHGLMLRGEKSNCSVLYGGSVPPSPYRFAPGGSLPRLHLTGFSCSTTQCPRRQHNSNLLLRKDGVPDA
jgi:hypothetical protein